MKEIFMAKKAFEACLMISALCAEVKRMLPGVDGVSGPGTAVSRS
jgi:hypothetical protein